MSLPENEKTELAAQSELLLELSEPEAWLEALRRIADRRAKELARGLMNDESAAKRWRKLASALEAAQARLEASDSPQEQS
jgi:hypothetical protein